MELKDFANKIEIETKTEVERVKLIIFYESFISENKGVSLSEVFEVLFNIGCHISNISRIKAKIKNLKDFKFVRKPDLYILNPKVQKVLSDKYRDLFENTEEINSNSELLDEGLFLGKRQFLDKLIIQANNTYQNHCYDATAVLLRRIFEILLIQMFEKYNLSNEIKDSNGDYKMLNYIVDKAVSMNSAFSLARNLKEEYEKIRTIGNFAAHKIFYNTRQKDIDDLKQIYRVRLEELYYKAGYIT